MPIEFDFEFFVIATYISSNIYILSISFFSYFLNQLTNSIHYPLLSSLSLTIYILNTTYLFLHEIRDTYLNFVYSISYCISCFNPISYCVSCPYYFSNLQLTTQKPITCHTLLITYYGILYEILYTILFWLLTSEFCLLFSSRYTIYDIRDTIYEILIHWLELTSKEEPWMQSPGKPERPLFHRNNSP